MNKKELNHHHNSLIAMIVSLCILLTIMIPVSANHTCADATTLTSSDYDTLSVMGFPEEIIKEMSSEDAQEFIASYQYDPDSVSVSTTVMEVDVLADIQSYLSYSYNEKLEMGLTDAQIDHLDAKIQSYRDMSDVELQDEFNVSGDQLNYVRSILDPNSTPDSAISLASDTIPKSKLTFTQAVKDYSTSRLKNYYITVYFNWNSMPFYDVFEDKIVVAWGGNFVQAELEQTINYLDNENWDDIVFSRLAVYNEESINVGGYYSFEQSIYEGNKAGTVQNGTIRFSLAQANPQGNMTKVISQYAHQQLSIGGNSISVSCTGLSPTIEIGTAYATSPQEPDIITN